MGHLFEEIFYIYACQFTLCVRYNVHNLDCSTNPRLLFTVPVKMVIMTLWGCYLREEQIPMCTMQWVVCSRVCCTSSYYTKWNMGMVQRQSYKITMYIHGINAVWQAALSLLSLLVREPSAYSRTFTPSTFFRHSKTYWQGHNLKCTWCRCNNVTKLFIAGPKDVSALCQWRWSSWYCDNITWDRSTS